MKMITLLLVASLALPTATPAEAQSMKDPDIAQRLQVLEDRAALKQLVDTFSNLADRKAIAEQVLLFTPDATVESIVDGKAGPKLQGREQLEKAFGNYLALFDTVYHQNGQQTVEVNGDRAVGTSYCTVVLIGTQDGKRTRQTSGVIYKDEYVRQNGRWLISKRTSNFTWRATDDA